MKYLPKIFVLLILAIGLMILFSPFEQKEKYAQAAIEVSTIIDASPCEVYEYLGDSDNAREWSSFVSHITPLEGEDGTVGSFRRCFKDSQEVNEQWDEEIVFVDPCRKRRLTVFNLQNFPVEASGLVTEQIYELTDENQCKLSFTLFLAKEHNTYWQQLKLHLGSYQIESIFVKNLENINRLTSNSAVAMN